MHTNGIHVIPVAFCQCSGRSPWQQLLDHDLFPGTEARTISAFSFAVLDQFEIVNIVSKTAPRDFNQALMRMTDGAFPDKVPVRHNPTSAVVYPTLYSPLQDMYQRFGPVIRQWRVLQMLKRAGVWTIAELASGQLALRCVACPRPDYNIPDDWLTQQDWYVLDRPSYVFNVKLIPDEPFRYPIPDGLQRLALCTFFPRRWELPLATKANCPECSHKPLAYWRPWLLAG